jgi:RND superfamily putative drug exporter
LVRPDRLLSGALVSSSLYRLGRWAFRARRLVLAAWIVVLALAGGAAALFYQGTNDSFRLPGTESGAALERLYQTFPQFSGASAQLVVVAPAGAKVGDPAIKGPLEAAVKAAAAVPGVWAVADPFGGQVSGAVSDDGTAALVTIQVDSQATDAPPELKDALIGVETTLQDALPSGATAALGGDLYTLQVPGVGATEATGLVVAIVVLLVTFGSFVAAGMPLLTALLGVGVSTALIYASTAAVSVNSTTPMLAIMLGLAVGLDYTLFVVNRHRAQMAAGMDAEESAARALATAGSAVVFAGLTVMIALAGLFVANIPFLTTMGIAAAFAVGLAVLIALTLTPALLGFAGDRLRPGRRGARARRGDAGGAGGPAAAGSSNAGQGPAASPAARADVGAPGHAAPAEPEIGLDGGSVTGNRFFRAWITAVTKVPLATIVVVIGLVALLAWPATGLRLALPDAGSQPEGSRARVTYDLVAEHFGPGHNGPLLVTGTIVGSTDPLGLMADLKREIARLPGVASVPLATPNQDATVGIIQVVPQGSPDSQQTADLVRELRSMEPHFKAAYGVDLAVTGVTAAQIDVSSRLGGALIPFGLLVVGLSFLLLTMVFRSLWVPLKATLGYVFSVLAAFGIVALVFERGWGAGALGVDRTGPVISFLPIVLMGVVFGLAMDYEVFLVSRMREDYVHRGDARQAVRTGFLASGKVVTAAAIIMVAVFASFIPAGSIYIKPIALGLASGVFIDAFVVRMTLVPAVLQLLGDRAWHFPRFLDRVLPRFDVEGEGLAAELRLADWPEPGCTDAIVGAGLRLDAPDGTPLFRDVDVRVPAGGTLVVAGPHRSGRTALLLTLSGRAHADAGVLKVAGLVAPVRDPDIRRRTAVATLTHKTDPAGELREAFASRAPIVVVDDLDAVSDPVLRDEVRDELQRARRRARDEGRDLTLVASCLDPAALEALLPPGSPVTTLDLALLEVV